MKGANTAIRRAAKAGREAQISALVELGLTRTLAAQLLEPDFAGRIGFPDYALKNNSANTKRIRLRIEQLQAQAVRSTQPDRVTQCGAYRVVECFADNRVRVVFGGKPNADVRSVLKRNGFRWSPSEGAWQRMLGTFAVSSLTAPDGYLWQQIAAVQP